LVSKFTVSGNQTNIVSIQNPFTTVFQSSAAASHNNLSDLQAAGTGVTYGHVNAGAQTIAGAKTFSTNPIIVTATLNDSTTQSASTAFVDRAVTANISNYTDEKAQDAVGGILDNGTIDEVFNPAIPS